MPPKNFRKISHPELKISLNLSNFSKEVSQLLLSKPTNRLTDKQKNCKCLELMYKHQRNFPKKFQKDISSRTEDIPILV